jgi:glucokinase
MKDNLTVGIDLGGTNIKAIALSNEDDRGSVLSIPTPSATGSAGVIDGIVEAVERAVDESGRGPLRAIGIGTPGLVDEELTIRGAAVNLPAWERFSLKSILENRLGVPVHGGNDVGLAAIAEYEFGAGRGSDVLVCIWLGTGIGGGILIGGEPFRGHNGIGGEIGHLVVEPGGRMCRCGQDGCAEAYGSATGMLTTYREQLPEAQGIVPTLSDFSDALRFGYEKAAQAAHTISCTMLARLSGIVLNAFAPDRIVFGGGVVQAGIPILEQVASELPRYSLPATRKQCELRLSTLGAEAGPLGAALLARRSLPLH